MELVRDRSRPTVCLLTAYDPGYDAIAAITVPRMQALADAHGYSFSASRQMCDRPGGWIKIPSILATLEGRFDFVFWLDIDAFVIRTDTDVRSEIVHNADLTMSWHDPDTALLNRKAPPHFNTGAMLIRANDWSRDFFSRVWQTGQLQHFWRDQATILHLLGYDQILNLGAENPLAPDRAHVARLNIAWNSVLGVACAADPIVHHYAGMDTSGKRRLLEHEMQTLPEREHAGSSHRADVSKRINLQINLMRAEHEIVWRDRELAARDRDIAWRDEAFAARDRDIAWREEALAARDHEIAWRDEELAGRDRDIAWRDDKLAALDHEIAWRDKELAGRDRDIAWRDDKLAALNREIAWRDKELAGRDRDIAWRDDKLAALDREIAWRDEALAARDHEIAWRDDKLAALGREIAWRDDELAAREGDIAWRDEELAGRSRDIAWRDEELAARDRDIAWRDEELAARDRDIKWRDEQLATRDRDIERLNDDLAALLARYQALVLEHEALRTQKISESD